MIKPASEFIAEAQKHCQCVNPTQAQDILAKNPNAVVLDVREPKEAETAKLACSINIPRGLLEMKVQGHCPDAEMEILIHCAAGGRASLAASRLQEMGYKNVYAITAKFEDLTGLLD